MLSKLFKGELSLAATFWKFGVLGLIVLNFAVRIFGHLLNGHLQGRTIYNFFFYPFYIVKAEYFIDFVLRFELVDPGFLFLEHYVGGLA